MIEEARRLYALDPADFVRERTALERALKQAGRRDDAAAVKALPKPRVAEHALNRIAHEQPTLAVAWADAVDRVESAQAAAIGGGDASGLREANEAVRAATAALAGAASAGRAPGVHDEVLALLRTLTSSGGRAQLRAGVVGSAAVDADDLFAGAPAPPPRPARAATPPRARREPPPRAPAGTNVTAPTALDAARQRRAEAAQRAAQAVLAKAEQAAAEASRDVARRERELAKAQRELDGARAAAAEANSRLEAARAARAELDS